MVFLSDDAFHLVVGDVGMLVVHVTHHLHVVGIGTKTPDNLGRTPFDFVIVPRLLEVAVRHGRTGGERLVVGIPSHGLKSALFVVINGINSSFEHRGFSGCQIPVGAAVHHIVVQSSVFLAVFSIAAGPLVVTPGPVLRGFNDFNIDFRIRMVRGSLRVFRVVPLGDVAPIFIARPAVVP